MKITVEKPEIVEPSINITLEIRNKEDLCTLWHLFNQNENRINERYGEGYENPLKHPCRKHNYWWQEIDKLVEEYGLKSNQV